MTTSPTEFQGKHATVGKTAEKVKGLAALAEKRRVKKERDANKVSKCCSISTADREGRPQDDADFESPRKARRQQSSSDESSEDGEIDKREEELEAERKEEQITVADLSKARITRDMLAKYCLAPWFEDFVKGMLIRFK